MDIKYTIQGLLIYAAMSAYLTAFLAALALRNKKPANILYFLAFLVSAAAFTYRWLHVRHVPLQNLFEVFLTLGMLMYPISLFCRRILKVAGDVFDMLLAAIVLLPSGFILNAEPQRLPPALQSWLFTPHVAVYILAYIFMAKAAFQASVQLLRPTLPPQAQLADPEQATYTLISAGFPLLTLGLILGSVWGKFAWGDYWGWDPKELWSLASWLIYVAYLHFRFMYARKHPNINSLWALLGLAVIIITLLWVNLSKLFPGLHSYAT